MRLFYAPHMASQAPLIVAHELGLTVELVRVDVETRMTAAGVPLAEINPKDHLPVLQLEDGTVLTETSAILIYLSQQADEPALMAPPGTLDFVRMVEWLSFFASEIHKLYVMLFWPEAPHVRDAVKARIRLKLEILETMVKDDWLVGGRFSIADVYFFIMANAAPMVDRRTEDFPRIAALRDRIAQRSAVREALERHG